MYKKGKEKTFHIFAQFTKTKHKKDACLQEKEATLLQAYFLT